MKLFRRHLLPLALVLALAALSPRSDEVIEFQSLELQFSALLPPVSSIVRRPLPVVTVDGAALGESMARVRTRLGEPSSEVERSLCFLGHSLDWGELHICGASAVETVQGRSLEVSGMTLLAKGDSRETSRSELGRPELTGRLQERSGLDYDLYLPEGLVVLFSEGKVHGFRLEAESEPYDYGRCCHLIFLLQNQRGQGF